MQTPQEQKAIVQRMIDAGESEANIATVIQHFQTAQPATEASQPFNPPRITQGRGTGYDPRNRPGTTQMLKENAPTILGTTAAALTGGASLPIQAAIMGGATAVGQGIKDSQWDMPPEQRVGNMVKAGAGSAALNYGVGKAAEGAAALLSPAKMKQAAKDLWLSAAKVSKTAAKQTQSMKLGGDVMAGKQEIAETVLSNDAGPIGAKSSEALKDIMAMWDARLNAAIQSSKKFIDRWDLEDAIIKKTLQIGQPGSIADQKALQALHAAYETVSTLPPKISVQSAQQKKEAIYKAWNYAAETSDSFGAQADKLLGRTYRSKIAQAEPAAVEPNAQLSKLIPATSAMDEATSRTANLSPVGLSKMLWGLAKGSASSALLGSAAVINDPRVGSWTAQKIYNLAQKLPKNYLTPANIVRVLSAIHESKDEP